MPFSSAWAADWYVDASAGDDPNDGTFGSPELTIAAGLADASAGDTVHVAAGTYAISTGLEPGDGVALISDDGAATTTITGAVIGGLVIFDGANAPITSATRLEGFTITNTGTANDYPGVRIFGVFCCSGDVVSPTISHNTITGNGSDGILTWCLSNVHICRDHRQQHDHGK